MRIRFLVRKFALFLSVLVTGMLCWKCFSISYSATGATPPGKTFSVQYVENLADIVEPGLSQQVTDALRDYIEDNSQLVYVNQNGDNDFEAVITGYDPTTPATIVAGDVAAQNKFTITVKVKYTCNVNPDLDFESSFSRNKLYNAEQGFESVKSEFTEELLNQILEDIYKRAFVNW